MPRIPAGFVGIAALCGLVVGGGLGSAAEGKERSPARDTATTITRGIGFLQQDVDRWKVEKKCSNCHHGVMTLWALNEAKRRGYAVEPGYLAELARWTKERLVGIEKPRDPKTGWSLISPPALYLAVMARNQPDQNTVSTEELRVMEDHVGRYLEDDGSVMTPATMSPPHPQNGPPPFFESREVVTLLATLALQPGESAGSDDAASIREARNKADAWLASITPGADTQAMALRLLVAVRERKPKKVVRAAMTALLERQNPDGGWGQLRELPSDAYATGQTLYILSLAGMEGKRSEIRRGVAFLAANQREDGSWPMKSRAQPGATPFKNPSPITHIGSSWAVIGLCSVAPNRS